MEGQPLLFDVDFFKSANLTEEGHLDLEKARHTKYEEGAFRVNKRGIKYQKINGKWKYVGKVKPGEAVLPPKEDKKTDVKEIGKYYSSDEFTVKDIEEFGIDDVYADDKMNDKEKIEKLLEIGRFLKVVKRVKRSSGYKYKFLKRHTGKLVKIHPGGGIGEVDRPGHTTIPIEGKVETEPLPEDKDFKAHSFNDFRKMSIAQMKDYAYTIHKVTIDPPYEGSASLKKKAVANILYQLDLFRTLGFKNTVMLDVEFTRAYKGDHTETTKASYNTARSRIKVGTKYKNSFGHEFFHHLDYKVAGQKFKTTSDYFSMRSKLIDMMRDTPSFKKFQAADRRKFKGGKTYWSSPVEMKARLGAIYLHHKIRREKIKTDIRVTEAPHDMDFRKNDFAKLESLFEKIYMNVPVNTDKVPKKKTLDYSYGDNKVAANNAMKDLMPLALAAIKRNVKGKLKENNVKVYETKDPRTKQVDGYGMWIAAEDTGAKKDKDVKIGLRVFVGPGGKEKNSVQIDDSGIPKHMQGKGLFTNILKYLGNHKKKYNLDDKAVVHMPMNADGWRKIVTRAGFKPGGSLG